MRWRGRRQSSNVEDRRGRRRPRKMALGGGLGLIVVIVVVVLMGGDPSQIMGFLEGGGGGLPTRQQGPPPNDEIKQFVSTIVADTETVWSGIFLQEGARYEPAEVILYSGRTHTDAGMVADCRLGPFYLPASKEIFIDPTFFDEMHTKLGAPGDFAQAYVIAHEVGHHVQQLLGTSTQVHRQQQRLSKREANRLSVRLELQADFYAGLWAHHAEKKWKILENPREVQEAITAANAIGDDRLQRQAGRRVNRDAFTHGTSEQRVRWFLRGFHSGRLRDGDTFSMPYSQL